MKEKAKRRWLLKYHVSVIQEDLNRYHPFLFRNIEDLEDEDDATAEIPILDDLLSLPPLVMNSNHVTDIPTENFEALKRQLEEKLNEYKTN